MTAGNGTGANASGSAEFMLAVQCCRRCFRKSPTRHHDLALSQVDWDQFLRLVRFHRIEGLAWNALADVCAVPDATRSILKDAASARAAENLSARAECQRLLKRFEVAEVPVLFLKGLTLGALAYGNPAIKSAVDIDLLIDPRDLDQAAELLGDSGYRLTFPRRSQLLSHWHRRQKESDWVNDSAALQIDLHTRTSDNPRAIPTITVHSNSRLVDIQSGISLPTLGDDELFAYLAVHGASSAWFRLKWISDFAALIDAQRPAGIERLYRRSQELRAGRAAGQALLLADTLFGTLRNNERLRRELREDRITRLLFRTAFRQLSGEPAEPTESRLGTLPIHWTQFLMLPGLGYKGSEFVGQASRLLSRF